MACMSYEYVLPKCMLTQQQLQCAAVVHGAPHHTHSMCDSDFCIDIHKALSRLTNF